jgi:hypothetical protein
MEATRSLETSIDSERTIRHYVPEGRSRHNHRFNNVKSYIVLLSYLFFVNTKDKNIIKM